MRKLFRYLGPYKWQVVFIIILTFAQVISQLYLPNLMSDIVDKGVVGQDINFIIKTGVIMLGFVIIVSACTILARYLSSRTAVGFAKDLRRQIFVHIEDYSLNEFDKIRYSIAHHTLHKRRNPNTKCYGYAPFHVHHGPSYGNRRRYYGCAKRHQADLIYCLLFLQYW